MLQAQLQLSESDRRRVVLTLKPEAEPELVRSLNVFVLLGLVERAKSLESSRQESVREHHL